MINPFPIEDPTLDEAIASAFADLKAHRADSDEYKNIINRLSALYELRNDTLQKHQSAQEFELKYLLDSDAQTDAQELLEKPFYMRIDPNTALTVLGNVFIGLAVIKYEQTGVISSKVMSFMKKI